MAKISPLSVISGAVELVAAAGAGAVVGNLVKATTPDDISKFQKVIVAVGGYTIGGVLSDLSSKYVRNQIEQYSDRVKSIFHSDPEIVDDVPEEVIDVVQEVEEPEEVIDKMKDSSKKVTKPKTNKKDSE